MIVYEFPFNERVRTLLRLEDLHERFRFFLAQEHPLEHHVALSTIFEMMEVIGRADLKSDLLQELERQKQTLMGYREHPNVQTDVLDSVLAEVEQVNAELAGAQGKTGQAIRDNEWLMSIRGRTSIPGGACEFDLPAYYAWQQRPAESRRQDIEGWIAPLMPVLNAIIMVLRLLRDSGTQVTIIAQAGSYQQMLQGKTYQLMRVKLDETLGAIPEASANKYMLWVRFTSQDGDMKPRPIDTDIPFELALC